MRRYLTLMGLCVMILAQPSNAENKPNIFTRMSGGMHVSTLGIGPQLIYEINPYATSRLTGSYFAITKDTKHKTSSPTGSSIVKVEAKMRLLSAGLLLDVHPFQNAFFMTVGAYYNGNRIDISGVMNNTIHLNNIEHTVIGVNEKLKGNITFAKFTPYLGLGSRWKWDWGSLDFSAGVFFQRAPKVKVTMLGGLPATVVPHAEAEMKKQLNKKAVIRYYPVVSLGVNIKF